MDAELKSNHQHELEDTTRLSCRVHRVRVMPCSHPDPMQSPQSSQHTREDFSTSPFSTFSKNRFHTSPRPRWAELPAAQGARSAAYSMTSTRATSNAAHAMWLRAASRAQSRDAARRRGSAQPLVSPWGAAGPTCGVAPGIWSVGARNTASADVGHRVLSRMSFVTRRGA